MPILIGADAVREPLYVVLPCYNPWRYLSRYKHTTRAIKHLADLGAVVILVEIAFNRREFVFADSGLDGTPANCGLLGSDHRFRHRYIPLRTKDELWLKENAINLAVATLPYDWQQVAWVDGDVHFVRPNVIGETIHKLQHYSFVQMFSHARDVGPDYEVMAADYPHADGTGFVQAWKEGLLDRPDALIRPFVRYGQSSRDAGSGGKQAPVSPEPPRVWPGLAWAATREAWDGVGGLLDFAVWGGGDYHCSHCLIEKVDASMMRQDLHPVYKQMVLEWAEGCRRHVRKNVGVVSGSVFHYWHGRKWDRNYNEKHRILAQIQFNPQRHLRRDYQGLYQLSDIDRDVYIQLRDEMRRVAGLRDEDNEDTREDAWRNWRDNH